MILDDRLLYIVSKKEIEKLKQTNKADWVSKVVQAKYSGNTPYINDVFRKVILANKEELLTMTDARRNSCIYCVVKWLISKYPDQFPEGYGWYSRKLLAKAYGEGKLIWDQLDD